MADKDPLILDFTNGKVFGDEDLDEYDASGLDDYESPYWDDIDLEDMFDLPPVLPPVRLPDEAELAVRAATELLTSGTYDSVAGGIAYDTMNDAVTAAP